ncbi:hypothetical protein M5K25_006597 [Dendrobium thyrsiflorum]|uniref:Uncharacterized protein n=1 Tax=Dendrobium thyrsiflorum TaxID=117978 RepID=A0ABD0VIT3_DENTH
MQMMYETIYRALREAGLEDTYESQDYLNFFCHRIRETIDVDVTQNKSPDSASTPCYLDISRAYDIVGFADVLGDDAAAPCLLPCRLGLVGNLGGLPLCGNHQWMVHVWVRGCGRGLPFLSP